MDVFTTPLPLCKWFNFLIFLILTQTYFSQAPARWEDPKENNTNPPRLPGRKIKFLAPFSDPIDIQNQKLIGFYRGGGLQSLDALLHVGLTEPLLFKLLIKVQKSEPLLQKWSYLSAQWANFAQIFRNCSWDMFL